MSRPNEFEVSDVDYNRFVFPAAVVQVISTAGSSAVGEPLYMSGNRQVLIRFRAVPRPIQLVFELEDGAVHELYVTPAPIRGVTREVGVADQQKDKLRTARAGASSLTDNSVGFQGAADIDLLEQFSMGRIPSAFEDADDFPPEVHFERFWAKPIAVWSDSAGTRVEAWRLIGRPGLAATVAPPQFYRPGVRSVLLENDIVDGRTHPLLLIVLDDHED